MAWSEGPHVKPLNRCKRTNKKLSEIEGELDTKEAQRAFAEFCSANLSFSALLLTGFDLYEFQEIAIRAMFEKDFFLAICGRGASKSTMASIFIPLYALFNPGVKIGICAPTFRQSRMVFSAVEKILNSDAGRYLKQCIPKGGEPKHGTEAWTMTIGSSEIIALPLGCLSGKQRVLTKDGYRKIETLFETKEHQEKNVFLKSSGQDKPQKSTKQWYNGISELLRLKMTDGRVIECTKEHKFIVKDKVSGNYDWKKAGEIKFNDNLILDIEPVSFSNPDYRGTFNCGYKQGIGFRFLKEMPEKLFSCNLEYLKGFLSGVFDESYEFPVNKVSVDTGFKLYNIPSHLLGDLQTLLSLFGINARINTRKKTLKLSSDNGLLFLKKIGFKKDSLYSFFHSVKTNRKVNKKKIYTEGDFKLRSTVGCIEKIEKDHCYDLYVDELNQYITNGFVTHNSGDKIRGYRFNVMIIDELLALPEKVINEVIMPFMAIQLDPKKRQETREAEDELIRQGVLTEDQRTEFKNNKLLGLTSASYKFEYLYKLFCTYIETIHDPDAKNVSHGVMQLSYEMAPKGLYDEANVENAKKSSSASQFAREYKAHFTDDSSGYFSIKKMLDVTLTYGDNPTIKIKGDPSKKYILGIDPNYNDSETSDHFAMCLLELDEVEKTGTIVHAYALSKSNIKHRGQYMKYLFDNFNIVYCIVDNAGGKKFIEDINELNMLSEKIHIFDHDFDNKDYSEGVKNSKKEYNRAGGKIVHSQVFNQNWNRNSNEILQTYFEQKRIFFGAPVDTDKISPAEKSSIGIKDIHFNDEKYEKSQKALKENDFIEHISSIVSLTRDECALIVVTQSASGAQRFDLPRELLADRSPERARKDSYSALILATWGMKCYFDLENTQKEVKKPFIPYSFS